MQCIMTILPVCCYDTATCIAHKPIVYRENNTNALNPIIHSSKTIDQYIITPPHSLLHTTGY